MLWWPGLPPGRMLDNSGVMNVLPKTLKHSKLHSETLIGKDILYKNPILNKVYIKCNNYGQYLHSVFR